MKVTEVSAVMLLLAAMPTANGAQEADSAMVNLGGLGDLAEFQDCSAIVG